jgi:RHS repeat-associated protein
MALVARGEERYINERHITGGLPLVSQTSEGVQYHQHDHLGTTVASYSQDGTIITAYETTVFGQGELEDSRTARFTGKPYDADLGAYVFPFRNYDPESARWLSADPSGFPDGPNQHYYAAVPTMGVDPLGLVVRYDVNVSQAQQEAFEDSLTNIAGSGSAGADLVDFINGSDYLLDVGNTTGNPGGAGGDLNGDGIFDAGSLNLNLDFSNFVDPSTADPNSLPNEYPPLPEITVLHELGHAVHGYNDLTFDENGDISGLGDNITWENTWRNIFGLDPRTSYRGHLNEI